MRVLHILDHSLPKISGYSVRSHAILKSLKSYNISVFAITSDRQECTKESCENIDHICYFRTVGSKFFHRIPIFNQIYTVFGLIRSVKKKMHVLRPNMLHAHSPCLVGIAAWYVAKKYQIPFIYEIRAFWEDAFCANTGKKSRLRQYLTRKIENFLCHESEKVIVICQGLENALIARKIPPEKIVIVPNGSIKENQIIQNAIRKSPHSSKKTIGFIGSFYPYEGLLVLCRAFLRCCYSHPEAHLLLIGNGPLFKQVKNFIDSFSIAQKVTLLSNISHDKIGLYYEQCDILVYPRLSCPLTEQVTPLKPLEAIAYRKPVLCSNVGGLLELMKEAPPEAFFEAGSVSNLTSKLEQWLQNPNLHEAWVQQAYQNLIQRKQWLHIAKRYLPEYEAYSTD